MARIDVRKTYKLFIGGEFPRSESGYSYVVDDAKGKFVANAALASRKDARDAVVAARKAFGGWSGRTAYNRAQVLYRVAEVMEDRRPQFVTAVQQSEGLTAARAGAVVDAAIDRLVWYAGWADKLTQVVGNANPVAGPFFNLTTPEPTGVVAVLAPQESSLLGLVSVVAPVVVTGNTAVVVSSYRRPLPAVTFAEVLATSDVPGGVVNILTGDAATVAPWLAAHMDVNAIDLAGVAGVAAAAGSGDDADRALATDLEVAAADNLKRVRRSPDAEPDWTVTPGLDTMTDFVELKTVWHPMGL
jgi:acyl-CoA reductase-like NAD-dependent aldehyde dehydrogenase